MFFKWNKMVEEKIKVNNFIKTYLKMWIYEKVKAESSGKNIH